MVVLTDSVKARVEDLCRKYAVRRLAVFGSALRDQLRPDSDMDLLVEFEPGRTPGFAFFQLQDELSDALGRRVDLNTPAFLSHQFRDRAIAESQRLYERRG